MRTLNVGVDSWIIQDGNYDDFVVGQKTKFALEFYPVLLKSSDHNSKSFTELSFNRYKICGQIICSLENVWVLDFGILAYQEIKPPDYAKQGNWVEGEIYLGIDPFFYFEYLKKVPEIPYLTYNLKIQQIYLETTPWIKKSDNIIARATGKESFKLTSETNAWVDDNGHASYILKCLIIEEDTKPSII